MRANRARTLIRAAAGGVWSVVAHAHTMEEIPHGAASTSSVSSAEATVDGNAGTTGPEAVAFDGTYIWIATQFNNRVTRICASDRSVAGTFAVGNRPVALLYAASHLWVANRN